MTERHEDALARSAVYELLSMVFLYPSRDMPSSLIDGTAGLARVAATGGWQDIQEALETLLNRLQNVYAEELESQYVEVFGHLVSADCPPYEGEYGQAHVFQKSQTLSDLNTFYSAFGVQANPNAKDRMDHISVEMEFMHLLTMKEVYAITRNHGEDKVLMCRQAQESFLANHLANWIKSFTKRLSRKTSGEGVYGAVARLLELHMDREFALFRLDSTPIEKSPDGLEPEEELECAAEAIPTRMA